MARLVLLETSGNQSYIFATNRMSENAGASQITRDVTTVGLIKAIDAVCPGTPYAGLSHWTKSSGEWADEIIRIGADKPLQRYGVEIIVSTSGKAVLLVRDGELGKELIWRTTRAALENAPGVVLHGVVSKCEVNVDNGDKDAAHEAMGQVHRDIETVRADLPAPAARFALLPFMQPCHSSGLPAQTMAKEAEGVDQEHAYAAPVMAKRHVKGEGFTRIRADVDDLELAKNPHRLDEMELDWVAVVHADGNGFGQQFMNLNRSPALSAGASARDYLDLYRRFSAALDRANLCAFRTALKDAPEKKLKGKKMKAAVPLVLGGDDLTVMCDGGDALRFTETFLKKFVEATSNDSTICDVTDGACLGAAAGVAIVKPHYPFHRAYALAEELLKSAKQCKTRLKKDNEATPVLGASALDFHILYDSAATDLDDIRQRWRDRHDGKTYNLTQRPFVIAASGFEDHPWCRPRRYETMLEIAKQFRATDDDGRERLPRSQQHALRNALLAGPDVARQRLAQIKHRYPGAGWEDLLGGDDGLFVDDGQGGQATRLIDAMELAEFALGGRETETADGEEEAA